MKWLNVEHGYENDDLFGTLENRLGRVEEHKLLLKG
jgi:hypothetical protein